MKAITLIELETEIYKNNTISELENRQNIYSFESLYNTVLTNEIVVIAGRPGMGKTIFIYNMLIQRLAIRNKKVLLLSTRDNLESILFQLQRMVNGLKHDAIIDMENILVNPKKISNSFEAKAFIEDAINEHDIKAVYIDDISELSFFNDIFNDEYADGSFSDYSTNFPLNNGIDLFFQFIKHTANAYSIPFFITEDISRQADLRFGMARIPAISDMRSEKLETLADKIYLLYRESYYGFTEDEEGNSTDGLMSVSVAKNKSGEAEKMLKIKLKSNLLYQ